MRPPPPMWVVLPVSSSMWARSMPTVWPSGSSRLAVGVGGLVVLGDLVVLGHVRVEVVLAGEHGPPDLAAQGPTQPHGEVHRRPVGHRQRARQPQAHRAHVGVGLVAEAVGAAAEQLGGRAQLHMDLQADYQLPVLGHRLLSLGHYGAHGTLPSEGAASLEHGRGPQQNRLRQGRSHELNTHREAVVTAAEGHRHRRVAGEVRRDRAHIVEVHQQRIGRLGSQLECGRRRGRAHQDVHSGVGRSELAQHQGPHPKRLAVEGVVVARRQRVGSEHDPALHLGAETGRAGADVHLRGVGRVHPQPVAHAVVAGQIAGRLGRRDQVVGRQAQHGRRHRHDGDGRARSLQCGGGGVDPGGDVGRHTLNGRDPVQPVVLPNACAPGAQLGHQPDPQAVHTLPQTGHDRIAGTVDRGGVEWVVPRDRLEASCRVGNVGRHRADLVERRGERDQPVARHRAVGGLEADHTAQRGRLADRASRVGPERQRREPCGHCRGRSPAGATGHPAGVVWVAGGSEGGVLGGRAHGELVEVRLADDDRAGGAKPLHHGGVVWGAPTLEHPRRAGGGHSPRAQVVLQRHRHTRQGPDRLAPRHCGVHVAGGRPRLVGQHKVERADLGVALGDPGEVLVQHVQGGAFSRLHRSGDPQGGHGASSSGAARRGTRPITVPRPGSAAPGTGRRPPTAPGPAPRPGPATAEPRRPGSR